MVIPKKILVISLIVILIGFGGYFLFVKKGQETNQETEVNSSASSPGEIQTRAGVQGTSQEILPLPVKAVPGIRGEVVIGLKSPGEAITEKMIIVKAEVGGVIENLNIAEGRHVREGDLLVELDDREFRLKLEKQQALRLKYLSELILEKQFSTSEFDPDPETLEKIAKAKKEAEQADELYKKGLLSRDEWDRAQKGYELVLIESGSKKDEVMASSKNLTQTEIDVKISEMELAKTRIRAAFSGIITDIMVSSKEHVSPGQELFTLVNIAQIKVKAKVLESEIGKMRLGREVDVRFAAYPDKVFKGRVAAISPIVNADDKTCAVHIAVDNPTEEIKPGMHAEVEIAAEIYEDRLIVPQDAILTRGGRRLVFVVEGNLAKWRYVEIGVENEHFAEILDGVTEGELVITEGHFTLAHDARVTVRE